MRVLHLAGSALSPFLADVSRLYAADCLAATAETHEAVVAYVTPDRRWRFPADLSDAAIAAAAPLEVGAAIARLDVDVAVPQMFCLPGMTHYRALLDVLGIPYAGNPPAVMALAADKARAKAIVAAAGVRVPRGEVVRPGERPTLTPPVVVKPVDADNSLGVSLVRDGTGYDAALAAAFAEGDAALVEDYVALGREVRCGIVVRGGELVALPLEEYRVSDVRSHADKLRRSAGGELRLVAKVDTEAWIVDPADPITGPVQAAARAAHTALGCRHYSLFDFRVDPAGRPVLLEASLYCSFARQSVLTTMAAAAGIPLPDLFATALAEAVG